MLEVPADSSHEPALFALLARAYIDQRVSRYRRAIVSRPAMFKQTQHRIVELGTCQSWRGLHDDNRDEATHLVVIEQVM
jgi:hypothetical protein